MEIWECLELLRKPERSWFFLKNSTVKRVNALATIAATGNPSLICLLTDFLKDSSPEVREATCKTIIYLFKKIGSKKEYYTAIRHSQISVGDIDFYKESFTNEQYMELLAICSLCGSGYVREKAVKRLAQVDHPRAIQFIVYRLADWVLQVRQAAQEAISCYKTTGYIDSLVDNLPIFEWLQKVERTDLSGAYQDIIEFITTTNRAYVVERFSRYPDSLRLLLARHISDSSDDYFREVALFLADRHFLIRSIAIKYFDKLGQADIEQLLKDKSANVRLQVLYCLKKQGDFEKTAEKFLSDKSAAIRHLARFTLKQSNSYYASFYSSCLQGGTQVVGSLLGLAETDGRLHLESAMPYLNNKTVSIKKAAFIAICKLDEECAYRFALANLDSTQVGVRNLTVEFLSHNPRQKVFLKARNIYEVGSYDLKKSMLKFFANVRGWATIPDLMLATLDENEAIRQLAYGYLQIWKTRATRMFLSPRPDELERAKRILGFVHEMHEDKQYFETNPVDGLGFYIK